jgi:DNA-binding transcriptional LysR family regulator
MAATPQSRLSSPSTARRIQELEDALGVSLYERYAHGVKLTGAGQSFLAHALRSRDILSIACAEAERAGAAHSGDLRLGFVWSFAAGSAREIISAYRNQHSQIRLQFTESGSAELTKQILAREIDCAWIVRRRPLDTALEVEPLWSEPPFLARRDGLYSPDSQHLNVLAGQPFLTRSSDNGANIQRRLDLLGGPKLQIHAHECSQDSLLPSSRLATA